MIIICDYYYHITVTLMIEFYINININQQIFKCPAVHK